MSRSATGDTRTGILILCGLATCAIAPACRSTTAQPRDDQPIELIAARGEVIDVHVPSSTGGTVTFGSLGEGVEIRGYDVERVRVRRTSTAMYGGGRGPGEYPDVLAATATPRTSPAYFELVVAPDAKPGERRTTLVAGERAIGVRLTITEVQLPPLERRVWAYYDPRELAWANLGTGTHDTPSDEERACIAMFRDYGVMLTPDLPISAWPGRRELLTGFPFIPTKLPKDPAAAAADVRKWIAATAGTGQLPFSIPIDEPRTADARARVRTLAAAVRAAGGGPSTFMFAVTDVPRGEYAGLIDLYITLAPKLADRHVRWTYNGAPPRAGSFLVDGVAPGPRTWGWLAWRWQIPIWYVWDALYWHDRHNRRGAPLPGRAFDPRVDSISFDDGEDHGNLDGVLALPGDRTQPCRPTLRLAAIRRGMQDRALIELASRCNPLLTANLVTRMVPRALGDAPVHGTPAWSTDAAAWDAARRELFSVLASCAASPAASSR